MLPKKHRLKKSEVETVFQKSKGFTGNGIYLRVHYTENKNSRFAVVISKKVLPKAVDRNKQKRQIMASIKEKATNMATGADVVVGVKNSLLEKTELLDREITSLFRQAKLI